MRCFFLVAVFIACVAGLSTGHVKKAGDKKHHKKHHGKHGKHHGKHHHHHHHGKHHKADGKHEDKHAKDATASKFMPPQEGQKSEDVWNRLSNKETTNPLNVHNNNVVNAFARGVKKLSQGAKKVSEDKVKGKENKVDAKKVSDKKVKGKETDKTVKGKENEEDTIVNKMKVLEAKLQKHKVEKQGQILVNGPLPADFQQLFASAVSQATGADPKSVHVTKTKPTEGGIVSISFTSSPHVVNAVEQEVSDPDSKLANGQLHSFLVAKEDEETEAAPATPAAPAAPASESEAVTPVQEKGIDIDTAMPYGDLEPFGREDTAQELTEDSIKESDEMVDQLERAEVAEEKRAVFRSLTRLRGAAITSFDGVARAQTGNLDEFNKIHKWREGHPLHHLADEESDVSKWAFPDNADF